MSEKISEEKMNGSEVFLHRYIDSSWNVDTGPSKLEVGPAFLFGSNRGFLGFGGEKENIVSEARFITHSNYKRMVNYFILTKLDFS